MSRKTFEEFINAQPEAPQLDWARERDEWLVFLNSLYDRVQEFLRPYVQEGKVRIEERQIQLNEELIGSYEARQLVIHFGSNMVHLVPIGTNLIAAKGRVDMKGPRGVARFVLVDKHSSAPRITVSVRVGNEAEPEPGPARVQKPIAWDWKIATSPPKVSYIEITADTFLDALLEVVNG